MTDPSKMTDADLWLAIAEELGWTKLSLQEPLLGFPGPTEYCGYNPKGQFGVTPNYPGDVAAAINDLVKDMAERGYWFSLKSPFYPGQPWFAGFTPHNTTGWNGRPDYEAGNENPARAISEAAYAALKAKGK